MSEEHIYQAIILGSGYGGLGQGAEFKRAGITDFLILERASTLGGVWRDNTYPGAACDTQSVIYCFSYFPHLKVSRLFAGQSELLGYLQDLAAEYQLEENLRFNHEIIDATWIPERQLWKLTAKAGQEFLTRAFVPAWGQLGTPYQPNFPGLENFKGESFHASRWRHDINLSGKRVASIGSAATAVQYVPEIAPEVAQLTVYQRSANYILPRDQHIFSAEESAEFLKNPETYHELRDGIHSFREAGFDRTRKGTEAAQEGMAAAREHLENQVQDPELRKKLSPDYDYGCKRILRSDDFYPALTRDNVELITEGIAEITPEGIRSTDGEERPFDIIIFATGFRSQAFQGESKIVGRNGLTLDQRWGDSPEAHLGITVDGFPNMFLVYGPNTNLNHNSVVTMIEAQNRYIVQCVQYLTDNTEQTLEPDLEVLRAYNDKVQAELEKSAYSSECSSWYKNAAGKVINNWCGTADEYKKIVERFEREDYLEQVG